MKRIIIDAEDWIIDVLQGLCEDLAIDRVYALTPRHWDDLEGLFNGDEKEISWEVVE